MKAQIVEKQIEKEFENSENGIKTKTQPKCKHCNSTNVYGMSRVVGYFSVIEGWNAGKKAELRLRQKGNYSLADNDAPAKKQKTKKEE